jgi:dTMP kinase
MADRIQFVSKLAGRFLVIDGPDGAGKGTQIKLLAARLAEAAAPCVTTHDPGDTAAGDRIRQILLHSAEPLDTATEVLLFMASRAQLVAEKIRPALAEGNAVICDRFISATCAYQGANGADLAKIIQLGRFAVGETWPDVTIVLDLPAEEGLRRIGVAKRERKKSNTAGKSASSAAAADQSMLFKDAVADTMEQRSLAFHRRVREIFRELPTGGLYPRPVAIVDGLGEPAEVHERIVAALARTLG